MCGFAVSLAVVCVSGGLGFAHPDSGKPAISGPHGALTDASSAIPDVLGGRAERTAHRPVVLESRVGEASATAARLITHGARDGVVRIDLGAWSADAAIRVIRDDGAGRFALAGVFVDEPLSQVVATVEGGVLSASIVSSARGSYRIRTGDVGYELVAVDASSAPGCGHPHERGDRSPSMKFRQLETGNLLRSGACAEDGSRIDLLVVYTPGAVTLAGGQPALDALIQAGVDETNLAMSNSLLSTQVNVVWSQEVAYSTSGNFGADLARLTDPDDGILDQVHQLRDDFKADLVCLVSEPGNVCGIAYISVLPGGTPNPDLGFNVVNVNCMTAPVSAFAHEIGHNLGVRHDWDTFSCTNGARRYAKAYVEPGETFQTVVGATSAPRVLHYSNPNVDIGGIPTGVAAGQPEAADAALTIAETAPIVARYRSRDCNGNGVCDDDDILGATSLDCNGNGFPDECEQDWNNNAVPDNCDIALGTSLDVDLDGVPDEVELPRLYVDQSAVGAMTGAAWVDARTDLQTALAIAEASGDVSEVWVAGGTYIPSSEGHRDRPFDIPPGVSMYGGFAGSETSLDERDIAANETILSGDLLGDDGPDMANRQDNAQHVVYYWQAGTVDFDGFTVTGGMADQPPNCNLDNYGGGMFVFQTDITIRDCLFAENAGVYGGGLSIVQNSNGVVIDSDFISNDAISTPQSASGAAMYFSNGPIPGSDPIVINARVIGNRSDGSGVITNIGGQPEYYNCLIAGNRSFWIAAAMNNASASGSDAIITGCTFVDNATDFSSYGGAIDNFRSDPTITSTIFWNNRNANGATESTQLSNSGTSVPIVNNSVVHGWSGTMAGVGTFDADPLFVDEPGGDFRLSDGSPALDAGDSSALPADAFDVDGDLDTAEALPVDLDGAPRTVDDPATDSGVGPVAFLDIGAYERAAAAGLRSGGRHDTGRGSGRPGLRVAGRRGHRGGSPVLRQRLGCGRRFRRRRDHTGRGSGRPRLRRPRRLGDRVRPELLRERVGRGVSLKFSDPETGFPRAPSMRTEHTGQSA